LPGHLAMFDPAIWLEVRFSFLSYRLTMGRFSLPTRRLFTVSLLAFVSCFLFAGCETGDTRTTTQSRSSSLASQTQGGSSVPQFSSIASISFMPPAEGVEGQAIRAQTENNSRLRQLIHNVSDLALNYSSEEVSADGLPVFYTPTVNPDGATMGGIWDRHGRVQLIGGRDGVTIEYTWTLPPDPSGLPTLLFFNQHNNWAYLGEHEGIESDYQVVEGDTIVLRLEAVANGWKASINGEELPLEATDRMSFGEVGQPVFYSRRHGTHTVTTVVNSSEPVFIPGVEDGGSTKLVRWLQKGLVFTEPFPEPDLENNPQEPITIENHIEWSDGSPLTDEEVEWEVAESDTIKSGTGKDILAIWNPIERTLTRSEEGEEEEQEVEDFEELDLRVSARTQVYEEKEEQSYPSFPYVIRHALEAKGAREFRIIGAEVLPEEPFTEENPFAQLSAEICLIGPEPFDYDVEWKVYPRDPEGNVLEDEEIASGFGYQIDAFWDGTVGGVLVDDPETYQFHIVVEACEGGMAFRAIRAQETEPELPPGCLGEVAQADVPIEDQPELVLITLDDPFFGRTEITSSEVLDADALNSPRTILDGQKIKLRDLEPDNIPEGTTEIRVSLDTSESTNENIIPGSTPIAIPLPYSGGTETDLFEFPADFYPKFFEEHSDDNQVKRGFTIIDAGSDIFFQSALVQGFLESDRNVLLGRSQIGADPTLLNTEDFPLSDEDDTIETSKRAMVAAGYESLELRADDPSLADLASLELNIRFRLENQAPLVFYRGRIHQPENVMDLGLDSLSATEAFSLFQTWDQVRTVVLTGSGALNLGNLGDTIIGSRSQEAANSGRPWAYSMISRGAERILGYNRRPPRDVGELSLETRATRKFLYLFNTRFYQNNNAGIDEAALAWVYGHVSTPIGGMVNGQPGPDRVTSAAAFTRRGYLFVYRREAPSALPGGSRVPIRTPKRMILFVPVSLWEEPEDVPDPVKLVAIPRVTVPTSQTIASRLATQFKPAAVNLENVTETEGVRSIDEF
jgi:hypothetical protein